MRLLLVALGLIVLISGCVFVEEGGSNATVSENLAGETPSQEVRTPRLIPSGMDYESYKQEMDETYPQISQVFDCDITNEECISSETNSEQQKFQKQEITLTVDPGLMQEGKDLTPEVSGPDFESETVYSFSFPDNLFLDFVKVSIDWPEDKNPADYEVVQLMDDEIVETKRLMSENGQVYFLTDHFSEWELNPITGVGVSTEVTEFYVPFSTNLYVKNNQPAGFVEYEITWEGGKIKGVTNGQGKAETKLPEQIIKNGEATIKVIAENHMVVVKDTSGETYSLSTKLDDSGTIKFSGDKWDVNAFKIASHAKEVKDFWLSYPSLSNVFGRKFLWDQVPITYSDPLGSYFTVENRNVYGMFDKMGIDETSISSFTKGDGNGDVLAHEYSHYVTRYYYGWMDWNDLSPSSAEHNVGFYSYSDKTTFKEDIAYFTESVFDGQLLGDLKSRPSPNLAERIPHIYERWDDFEKRYFEAKGDDAKQEDILEMAKEYYLQDDTNRFIKDAGSPFHIDGLGGLILYDMYEQNGRQEFIDFWNLLKSYEPLTFEEFAEDYRAKYGEERFKQLNDTMTKYGANTKWERLDKFWRKACRSDDDCDDGNPCTGDFCVEEGTFSEEGEPSESWGGFSCDHPSLGGCENPTCYNIESDEETFTASFLPEECKTDEGLDLDVCTFLCCDYGKTWAIVKSDIFATQESADCHGVGTTGKCITQFVPDNLCCNDEDCKQDFRMNKEYYETFAPGTEPKCIEHQCYYVREYDADAIITCETTPGSEWREEVTECYVEYPEEE